MAYENVKTEVRDGILWVTIDRPKVLNALNAQTVEQIPKPVIAAINGFALGGGCELALACHIRIASDKAQIGLPEVSLGIIPGYGGTQRMARLLGKAKALELICTGDRVGAADAERIGLVNKVVAPEQLMPAAEEMARKIMTRGPLA